MGIDNQSGIDEALHFSFIGHKKESEVGLSGGLPNGFEEGRWLD